MFALDPRNKGESFKRSEQERGRVRYRFPSTTLATGVVSVLLNPEHAAECQPTVGAPAFIEGKPKLEQERLSR